MVERSSRASVWAGRWSGTGRGLNQRGRTGGRGHYRWTRAPRPFTRLHLAAINSTSLFQLSRLVPLVLLVTLDAHNSFTAHLSGTSRTVSVHSTHTDAPSRPSPRSSRSVSVGSPSCSSRSRGRVWEGRTRLIICSRAVSGVTRFMRYDRSASVSVFRLDFILHLKLGLSIWLYSISILHFALVWPPDHFSRLYSISIHHFAAGVTS